ncbi:MAG: hypothetical protein R3C16_13355 [Hyphomonadaceae bacterium]
MLDRLPKLPRLDVSQLKLPRIALPAFARNIALPRIPLPRINVPRPVVLAAPFVAIAFGGVVALDFVVTGGAPNIGSPFDAAHAEAPPAARATQRSTPQPRSVDLISAPAQVSLGTVIETAYTPGSLTAADLLGGPNGDPVGLGQVHAAYQTPDDATLYREIDALYRADRDVQQALPAAYRRTRAIDADADTPKPEDEAQIPEATTESGVNTAAKGIYAETSAASETASLW